MPRIAGGSSANAAVDAAGAGVLPALDAPLSSLVRARLNGSQMRQYFKDRALAKAVDTMGVRTKEQALELLWGGGGPLNAVQAEALYAIAKRPQMPYEALRHARGAKADPGPWLHSLAGCFSEELEDDLAGHSVVQQRCIQHNVSIEGGQQREPPPPARPKSGAPAD